MTSSPLPVLARTVRQLRASQLAYRLKYRVLRRLEESPWLDVAKRTEARIVGLDFRKDPLRTPADLQSGRAVMLVDELSRGWLTLLNQARPFRGGEDWCMQGGRDADRLWKYTLHYHGWLVELALLAADDDLQTPQPIARLLGDWLATCRLGAPGFTHYAWNSYTISTRLDFWRQLHAALPAEFWQRRPDLAAEFRRSFALQAAYLQDHLEWDLRGNHLLRDALGLACAGRMFCGAQSERWLQTAAQLALAQANEQVLRDGGHFERSPMYHALFMLDLLKLICLLDEPTGQALGDCWERMAAHLAWLVHPDGTLPQLNDATRFAPAHALEAGSKMGLKCPALGPQGTRYFPDTGLVAARAAPWTLFFDVGEVGPTYQPGHAHADTLSIECSYRERRLLIDPGCLRYDNDDSRRHNRATASHNTVCIDEQDSSEVYHIFRVGRRASPVDVRLEHQGLAFTASAAHTGYDHLPGKPRHHRQVRIAPRSGLQIEDRICGRGTHRASGGYLLAPEWSIQPSDHGWTLRSGSLRLDFSIESNAPLQTQVERSVFHPDFGVSSTTQRLGWRYEGELPLTVITLIRPEN